MIAAPQPILQQGLSQAEGALVAGMQRQTVNVGLQRYRAQGEERVLDGRRVSPRRGKGVLATDDTAVDRADLLGAPSAPQLR